jgi:hypothetical protein
MRPVPFVSLIARSSPRKRLWLAGAGLALFLLTFVVGNGFIRRDRAVARADLGHDFLAFYTAATFVRDGHDRQLYDLDAVRQAESATARAAGIDLGTAFGPWWNPPFYALALEPLAALPYATALDVWRWINLAALVAAAAVLGCMTPSQEAPGVHPGLRSAALILLLLATSMPFIQAIGHAQNTCTSLLLLSVTVALWRSNRPMWAGLVGGLLFYKPQLAAVVAGVMAVDLGWAAVAGLSTTGLALLLVTAVALPGSLGDWLHKLPANVRFMQVDHPYLWDRHVTIKSFWRLLLQGTGAGEATMLTTTLTAASWIAIAGGLAWVTIRSVIDGRRLNREDAKMRRETRRSDLKLRAGEDRIAQRNSCSLSSSHLRAFAVQTPPPRRDRLITATICATPLLMPFYFDYDLLLLAVPITLYAMDRDRDRLLTTAWVATYCWMFINAPVASQLHVCGAVVQLAFVAAMSIRRVNRSEVPAASIPLPQSRPVAVAA